MFDEEVYKDIMDRKYEYVLELQNEVKVSFKQIKRSFYTHPSVPLKAWCKLNDIELQSFISRLPIIPKNKRIGDNEINQLFDFYKSGLIASPESLVRIFKSKLVSLEALNKLISGKSHRNRVERFEVQYGFQIKSIFKKIIKKSEIADF
ncbi:MAG: hypothetical protein DRG78_03700 [Epsilonproteobacteria bacterium]|nr:MAG: hypothetical protein DRG78_03700 [Campylobacterota bacterium]